MSIECEDQEYMAKVKAFAERIGKADQLKQQLNYLGDYAQNGGERKTRCRLFKDFAPASFEFIMEELRGGEWKFWFNGACIYHGPQGAWDGPQGPTFSVELTATDGWSIHT